MRWTRLILIAGAIAGSLTAMFGALGLIGSVTNGSMSSTDRTYGITGSIVLIAIGGTFSVPRTEICKAAYRRVLGTSTFYVTRITRQSTVMRVDARWIPEAELAQRLLEPAAVMPAQAANLSR